MLTGYFASGLFSKIQLPEIKASAIDGGESTTLATGVDISTNGFDSEAQRQWRTAAAPRTTATAIRYWMRHNYTVKDSHKTHHRKEASKNTKIRSIEKH